MTVMILFQLRCGHGHGFEGWFRNGAAYDEQAAAGAIACPVCGDTAVSKAPMAPSIVRGRSAAPSQAGPSEPASAAPQAPAPVPVPPPEHVQRLMAVQGALLGQLRELRRQVEANAEPVGNRFAEEARKIHYGESERRAIYGDTTDAEAEALREEGIEFARIPWVPPHDS